MALISEAELAEALGVNQALADRLHAVALALVERYASSAPEAIQSEAIIRASGWLAEQPMASIRSEETGDIRTSYATSGTNALKHSGATALLAPWRVYRAGVIE